MDRLRGREPAHWVTNQSSIDQVCDDVTYERAFVPHIRICVDEVNRYGISGCGSAITPCDEGRRGAVGRLIMMYDQGVEVPNVRIRDEY